MKDDLRARIMEFRGRVTVAVTPLPLRLPRKFPRPHRSRFTRSRESVLSTARTLGGARLSGFVDRDVHRIAVNNPWCINQREADDFIHAIDEVEVIFSHGSAVDLQVSSC